jgi:hypothetical protein
MVDRLEIPKRVKLAVFLRAGGPENVTCEGCKLRLGGKPFDYDHTIEEWEQTRPKAERVITADDVKLLGYCCHKSKTARKAGERAHGKRIVEKAARVNVKPPSRYRKKLNGQVVDRQTGEVIGGRV